MKIIVFISLIILVGGAFLMTKQDPPISDAEVIDKRGVHWHPKLTIYVKGEKKELDDGIGLGAKHESIHTHTEDYKDGVVHIEKQGVVTKDDIKLGNFFKIWGKDINENGKYKMYVNGVESTELDSYLMRDKDLIEIKYE